MNFRLPAFALLTLLLALSHAHGQASDASYQQSISQAPTSLTISTSSSVVGLESPPTLSAAIAYPASGQTTGNVTFTVENGSTVVATGTAAVNLTGVATWAPSLPTGRFTILAVYSGDSNLLGSGSGLISQTVLGPGGFQPLGLTIVRCPGAVGSGAGLGHLDQWLPRRDRIQLRLAVPPRWIAVCCQDRSACPHPLVVTPIDIGGRCLAECDDLPHHGPARGIAGAFLLSLLSLRRRRRRLLPASAALALLLTGCGTPTRYVQHDGTPKGSYSITVTGTSGQLSHSQTVLVTVQ